MVTTLEVAAARYALGIPCEEDRRLFAADLERMFDADQLPSRDEAVWTLLRYHIGRIAKREIPPREGLRLVVYEAYLPAHLREQTRHFVGDSHGIETLYGAYYSYDDLSERPTEVSFNGLYGDDAIRALDDDVVRRAGVWSRDHSESR